MQTPTQILASLTHKELTALRRSNDPDYETKAATIELFAARIETWLAKHPDTAFGMLGPDLGIPADKFNQVLDRCIAIMFQNDDTRFSLYDLMDAIGHAPFGLDIEKLLSLSDEDFYTVITTMADAKRRTYYSDFEMNHDTYPTADDLDDLITKHSLKQNS